MRKIFIILVFWASISQAQTTHVINPSEVTGSSAAPSNVIYLSKVGIVSDAVLDTGSTTFGSDQTAAIQAILNTASQTVMLLHLTVNVDVRASVTGLKIKSNTTVNIMPTCGFVLRDNSNKWLLVNYNWTPFNNSIVDSNITINGGILNCNGWRGGIARQNHSDSTIGMTTGLMFWGTKNTRLENVHIMNARTWCIATLTTENFYMNNCFIDQGASAGYNQDGITNQGYIKGFTITNCKITSGDDKIAFAPNATGGTIGSENHYPYTGVNGDELGIRVDNVIFTGNGKGLAFYVVGGNKISDVHVSNLSGTCQSAWLDIENYLPGYIMTTGSQSCHNFTFENIGVEVTSYVGYGDTEFPLANIMCSVDNLIFRNVSRFSYAQNAVSFKIKTASTNPVTINNLIIDGFYSVNTNPANYPPPGSIAVENATVNRLSVLNAYCDFGTPTWIDRPLLNINSTSTVHNLFLQNINFKPLKSIVGIQGTVDYLAMNNVIHTGNADSTGTLNITGTLTKAVVSNYVGKLLYTGTIGTLAQSNSVTTP